MRKTALKDYVYDFSVNYNAIVVSDIVDMHKYLMKSNEIVRICEANNSFKNDAFWL